MHNIDQETLRERVDEDIKRSKRVARGIFFGVNLFMFVLFVIISILMVSSADIPPDLMGSRNSPVLGPMIMLGMGWLTSLIFQGILLVMDTGAMDRSIRERAVAREINRQIYEQATGDFEKPKRRVEAAQDYTVSDDGELIPLDDENSQQAKRS